MIWLKISAIYLGIILLKGFYSLINYIRLRRLYSDYQSYIKEPYDEFDQKVSQIRNLFKKANVEDAMIPLTTHEGYGQVLRAQYSAFSNISTVGHDFISIVSRKFNEALGEFKHRAIQSINPVYWVEFLLTFPQQIFGYFNVSSKNTFVKGLQVIYWVTMILVGLQTLGVITIIQ